MLAPTEWRRTVYIIRRHTAKPSTRQLSITTRQHWQRWIVVRTATHSTDSTWQWWRTEVCGLATSWGVPRQWMILEVLSRLNSTRWNHPAITTCTNTPWSIKTCHFYFLNSFVKHWPILIIFGTRHKKKLHTNDSSFGHLTLILSLHYLVKCKLLNLLLSSGVNVCSLHLC